MLIFRDISALFSSTALLLIQKVASPDEKLPDFYDLKA